MSRISPVSAWKCGLALVASLVVVASSNGLAAAQVWQRVDGADFVLYSDAATRDVTEFAVQYSAYHHALNQLFAAPGHTLPPSTLVLFRRDSDFTAHTPKPRSAKTRLVSSSVDVDGTALLALSVSGDRYEALARTFEFETVWALHRMGYFLPIWAAQGAGEALATLDVSKGRCLVGRESGNHSEHFSANRDVLPWSRFFEISENSPEYAGRLATGAFHSQAWALMHWILLKDDATSARFQTLAQNLKTMSAVEAVAGVMGEPVDHFTEAIGAHLRQFRGPRALPFDEKAVAASLKIVPADEAEILVQTSNLLSAAGRADECNAQLERARQLAPDRPAVKEAWARRALREDQPAEATRLYREAIAAGSRNVVAYLISATARLDAAAIGNSDSSGGGGPDTLVALEEVRQALVLNPGSPDAYRLLGRTFWILPQVSEPFVNELSPGITADEAGAGVRFYRALLYARLGKSEECFADLRNVIADHNVSARDRERAKERLLHEQYVIALNKVNPLVAAKQHDAARGVITAAMAEVSDEEAAERFRALLAWVDENAAWTKLTALLEEQRWTELKSEAQAFVENFPKSRNVSSARHLGAEAARIEKLMAKAPASPPAGAR